MVLDEELQNGSTCVMCHGTGHEVGILTAPPCCWCLGEGVVPSRKKRRLDSKVKRGE